MLEFTNSRTKETNRKLPAMLSIIYGFGSERIDKACLTKRAQSTRGAIKIAFFSGENFFF